MRGETSRQKYMFSYVSLESRVPPDHPLRAIKAMSDEILKGMDAALDAMYEDTGRRSVPPERLLKSERLYLFLPFSNTSVASFLLR